jgi:hypothetical protein
VFYLSPLWHAVAHGATLDFLEFGSVNKSSIVGIVKGLVMAGLLALVTPSTSWADDHFLSVNNTGTPKDCGTTPTNCAIVTDAGTVTRPLVLINFDGNPTLTFGAGSQTLTVVRMPVKMCKPGTKNQLEWLDQGNTVVGVNGTLTDNPTNVVGQNGYRLVLTFTLLTDTYGSSNGGCSTSGQKSYTSTSVAKIDKRNGSSTIFNNKLTSTYDLFNATINGAPEPDTVLLMLMGLVVLGWMSRKSLHTARGASA